jgi:hypothetical protein
MDANITMDYDPYKVLQAGKAVVARLKAEGKIPE